ncbi:hypothetical protein F5Y00DRAFT_235684 [Daldinia vernicosa]|uniref:uncharacterized protein n=1 Tax=Daldinia vernicosa TaxID=114800 RepID=UPI0020088108|nr:uncharacterized protein F5Y00DRAFT_235684 [Daldinia vernicosa]KAI0849434.1 hypothetical protein F5Y00DRAFT_235684 [Daldinia vernicosa]
MHLSRLQKSSGDSGGDHESETTLYVSSCRGRDCRIAGGGGGRLGRRRNGATSADRGLRYLSADAGHNGRVRHRGDDGSNQAAGAGRVSSGERRGGESREGRERLGRVRGESHSRVRSESLAWGRSLTRSLNRTGRVGSFTGGLNRASGGGSLAGCFDRTGRVRCLTRGLNWAGFGWASRRRGLSRGLNWACSRGGFARSLNRASGGGSLARGLDGTSGVRGESLGNGRNLSLGHRADGGTNRDSLSGSMRLTRLAGAVGNLRSARSDSAGSGRVDGRGGVLRSRDRCRVSRSSGGGRRVSLGRAGGR